MKFIHAHQIANAPKANPANRADMILGHQMRELSAATPKAITNVRSNSNSNGLATRCCSCGSRPDIRFRRWA